MSLRLYVVPASHPCAAVETALQLKGLDYKVTELPQGVHLVHQRLRFGHHTVPSLKANGTKVSGSREIMRWLDEQRPEPPLLPDDPEVRAAEEWGATELQDSVRRILWWALRKRPDAMPSYLAESKLPMPAPLIRLAGRGIAPVEWKVNDVSVDTVRADVAAVPEQLRRITDWMEAGVLGGDPPNAADLQIGSSLALLRTVADFTAQVDASRGGELARRHFPDYPGSMPAGVAWP